MDLDEILDQNDKPILYSAALRDKILSNYGARLAMWDTYVKAVTKARLGN